MHVMLVGLLLLLVVLAIPFIWKPEGRPPLNGPALDDLTYREIAFESGELRMGGMLFLPDVPGPHPLTVLIHGSGPSSRDSAWYLSIADHLQRNGIAVLLPDKRGCEQSEGDWRTASLPELAEDTVAAVAYGARLDDAAFSTIGVMGLSQGGWIAPVAATLNPEVDFVVSMSGAAVPTDEQLLHEEIHSIERMGTYHFVARLLAPLSTARLRRMDFGRRWPASTPCPIGGRWMSPSSSPLAEGIRACPWLPAPNALSRLIGTGSSRSIPMAAMESRTRSPSGCRRPFSPTSSTSLRVPAASGLDGVG